MKIILVSLSSYATIMHRNQLLFKVRGSLFVRSVFESFLQLHKPRSKFTPKNPYSSESVKLITIPE